MERTYRSNRQLVRLRQKVKPVYWFIMLYGFIALSGIVYQVLSK
ncbi:hypothetical protein [Dyadobacter sp. LHD-138]|nr:hypothetical protein [Dyadobacter sp. LHD-138]MDQ6482548.1 hypothetical protein [Dyadobacter sp. LHD-138]